MNDAPSQTRTTLATDRKEQTHNEGAGGRKEDHVSFKGTHYILASSISRHHRDGSRRVHVGRSTTHHVPATARAHASMKKLPSHTGLREC